MNFKHNTPLSARVKTEPREANLSASTPSQEVSRTPGIFPVQSCIKSERVELPTSIFPPATRNAITPITGHYPSPRTHVPPFTTYGSAQEIAYTPEAALKEGLDMIKVIKRNIIKLELGSQMRKDVWLREITGLENRGGPTTLIAICGATGAGKSSLLNAILDDNIVPTSGMRACTAVVTEIGYHDKQTIEADVSFLTLDEWKEELVLLLDDLMDEDGTVKRTTDLRSEAGIAWYKVHAVYPLITPDQVAKMTPEQIIERDPSIARLLGTSKHICAGNSQSFATQISEFVDSKSRKGGQKKKKGSKDDKKKGIKKQENKSADLGAPALWPLIRQVVVKCKSSALSTGAILVDLPGVADANAARNSICSDYMKKCQAIWVLAPITRAVDDRTAKDLLGDAFKIQLKMDGNYDDHAITFVATKTDDVSCEEIIRSLKLEDDEEIEAVEEKIRQIKSDRDKWKTRKTAAVKAVKAIEKELKEVRAVGKEYHEHLKALRNGIPFQPKLTAKTARPSSTVESPNSRKRKWAGIGKKESPKRRRNIPEDDASDPMEDDEVDEVDTDNIEDSDRDDGSESDSSSSLNMLSESDKGSEDGESDSEVELIEEMDDDDEVTEASLKDRIGETEKNIKTLRERLSGERVEKKKAYDEMTNASEKLAKAQREKNGICATKRSELSRDILVEDFRSGLREIDEADAQERDPDNFDPTKQLRNYDDITIPTFCASARDYMRIKRQVKGDGKPTCFTNIYETNIPALQDWCKILTVSSRQRAAKSFFTHLLTFTSSVQSYLQGITEVREEDRKALRDQWESIIAEPTNGNVSQDYMDAALEPSYWLREDAWNVNNDGTFSAKKVQKSNISKTGVASRLSTEFEQAVDVSIEDLKKVFADGLNEKLQKGAANAAAVAVSASDEFAASMHWNTYRATLRRYGSFRRCLNTVLITPLTKNIASSWAAVFEADLFASLEAQAILLVTKLIRDVEKSAAPGLQDRARYQGGIALDEAKVAMSSLVALVRTILNDQQKEISRRLVPNLQDQLRSGYREATEQRGPGSVARQKRLFHDFIKEMRNVVFNGGADALLEGLDNAAFSVGDALDNALGELAQKIEVSLSVLWEIPHDDPRQLRARRETLKVLQDVDRQIALWTAAAAEQNAQSAN